MNFEQQTVFYHGEVRVQAKLNDEFKSKILEKYFLWDFYSHDAHEFINFLHFTVNKDKVINDTVL